MQLITGHQSFTHMSSPSFEQLYGAMIAGSVPSHSGDVEQSAAYAAADALDTASIHYYFSHVKGESRAYYFAVPSKALSSTPVPRIPLTAAIPGTPGHQGEGAYLVTEGGLSAAAIYQNGDLRLIWNSQEVIQRHLGELGVQVFEVDEFDGELLASSRSRGRGAAEKLSSVVSKVSIFTLGLGLFTWFGLSVANGYTRAKVEDNYLARSQALASVTQEMNFSSPLSQQVARLHSLAAVALQHKGYIERFEYRAGVTSYEVAVPRDAEEAAIKALGTGHEASDRDGMTILSYSDGRATRAAAAPAAASQPAAPAPASTPTVQKVAKAP